MNTLPIDITPRTKNKIKSFLKENGFVYAGSSTAKKLTKYIPPKEYQYKKVVGKTKIYLFIREFSDKPRNNFSITKRFALESKNKDSFRSISSEVFDNKFIDQVNSICETG